MNMSTEQTRKRHISHSVLTELDAAEGPQHMERCAGSDQRVLKKTTQNGTSNPCPTSVFLVYSSPLHSVSLRQSLHPVVSTCGDIQRVKQAQDKEKGAGKKEISPLTSTRD